MRLTDYDKLQLKLREYADRKASNGEIELANGILKAKYFIDQECTVIEEKQLNNGWIPVSERLPTIKECQENDCRFIVTDGNRRYQNWFDYEDNYFDRCACNGLGLKRDSYVIAWQPLPEPYKEDTND